MTAPRSVPTGRSAYRRGPRSIAFGALVLLGGCATTAIDDNFQQAQRLSGEQFGTELKWLRTDDARREAQANVDRLLAAPLAADDAVRIALAHSPSLQAMLFEGAARSAAIDFGS